MNIHILFGTESGNSELVASDVFDALSVDENVQLDDLADVDPAELVWGTLYLIICSTHGEGEVPQSAFHFWERASEAAPDLTGIRYAMFGLGDSTYPQYSRGSEHIDELLTTHGATRVGDYGRHDAAGRYDASELATEWALGVLAVHAVAT